MLGWPIPTAARPQGHSQPNTVTPEAMCLCLWHSLLLTGALDRAGGGGGLEPVLLQGRALCPSRGGCGVVVGGQQPWNEGMWEITEPTLLV